MIQELILASGNKGKIAEFQRLLDGMEIQVQSMKLYPEIGEIVEDGNTFAENALKKARTVCQATGKPALADDGRCSGRSAGNLFCQICRGST